MITASTIWAFLMGASPGARHRRPAARRSARPKRPPKPSRPVSPNWRCWRNGFRAKQVPYDTLLITDPGDWKRSRRGPRTLEPRRSGEGAAAQRELEQLPELKMELHRRDRENLRAARRRSPRLKQSAGRTGNHTLQIRKRLAVKISFLSWMKPHKK